MMRVAVLQSNYIPWKGYFDIINSVDLFVFYDDLQYTKNDWRNRNKIKTNNGSEWITIPVGPDTNRLICEVEIKDSSWQKKHWRMLKQHYGGRPFFSMYESFFEEVYLHREWHNLSELNQFLIIYIAKKFLGVTTEFSDSREYSLGGKKLDRLLELLIKTGANLYVSGPSAKSYILEDEFKKNNILIEWFDYSSYPVYPQAYGEFIHSVTILDLLFNTGNDASASIWGWRQKGPG
jgi:hypothetical protein